ARPLYLVAIVPLAAVAIALAISVDRLALLSPVGRASVVAAAAISLLAPLGALALRSHERATLYSDPAALWADAARKTPESARPWTNLGVELLVADRLDEAERALRRALALDPENGGLQCALDSIHIRRRTLAAENRSRE
ncbi:MAG TPA: tetratricopeptide repeat protein, partial [Thermoanaerobaculia bacterium]|nr:tetratricopeptide repeat protein [Thermoanaerobaculia bacterium]